MAFSQYFAKWLDSGPLLRLLKQDPGRRLLFRVTDFFLAQTPSPPLGGANDDKSDPAPNFFLFGLFFLDSRGADLSWGVGMTEWLSQKVVVWYESVEVISFRGRGRDNVLEIPNSKIWASLGWAQGCTGIPETLQVAGGVDWGVRPPPHEPLAGAPDFSSKLKLRFKIFKF